MVMGVFLGCLETKPTHQVSGSVCAATRDEMIEMGMDPDRSPRTSAGDSNDINFGDCLVSVASARVANQSPCYIGIVQSYFQETTAGPLRSVWDSD